MSVITVERGNKVRHRAEAGPSDATGTVVAVFLDLRNHPCAAVQWSGGYLGVSRLAWLVKL